MLETWIQSLGSDTTEWLHFHFSLSCIGGGNGNPLQYACLENPHGQRSLPGYSPWGHKESDMTEWLSTWITILSWWRVLHNSVKLWAMPCRANQDGQFCIRYVSKFGRHSSGHRTGKGQFSWQSPRRVVPKNALTTCQLHSSPMLVRSWLKSSMLGFRIMGTRISKCPSWV